MTRTMRVIAARMEQDPGLITLSGGAWVTRMHRVASGIRRHRPLLVTDGSNRDALSHDLALVGAAVAREIGSMLTEATTVREYLSVTTGRVLARLAAVRAALQEHTTEIDDLDEALGDFAALAGLWQESTVRGPAWRIGDTGRRLERCLVVCDLLEGVFDGADVGQRDADSSDVEASAIEVLLAANDSLVAYRRRHRSDVEREAAIALLVRDASNPRSLAASIDRLAHHASEGEFAVGASFIAHARSALDAPVDELVPHVRRLVLDAGAHIVERWFSTPVNPIVMRPTGDAA
jgi:uncharacterized alpha-E superfamily protein